MLRFAGRCEDDDGDKVTLPPQGGAGPAGPVHQLLCRRDKLLPKLQKILLRIESPDYESNVPAEIRQKLEMKVSSEYLIDITMVLAPTTRNVDWAFFCCHLLSRKMKM